MKTLQTTNNGGFPFELDDIRWTADGIAESLQMAGNVIGDNFVIDGVVPTLTPSGGDLDVTHTAGKVFFDGEFCEVDALTVPLTWISGDACWFAKDTTFDPSGNETFEDASVHDTYQIVKVKLFTGATIPSGGISLISFTANANRIPALVVDKIVNEKIVMNERVQFKNASATTTASNIAAGGVFEMDDSSNAEVVEFSSPVVDLVAIDSGSASLAGQWKIVQISTMLDSVLVIHQSAGSVGGRFKINTKNGQNRRVKNGDILVFWNDGSNWNLVEGGVVQSLAPEVIAGSNLSGTWGSLLAPTAFYYNKNEDGLVSFGGIIENLTYTTTTDDEIYTMPAGYIPARPNSFTVVNDVGSVIGKLIVDPSNGKIKYHQIGLVAAPVVIALNGIQYYV